MLFDYGFLGSYLVLAILLYLISSLQRLVAIFTGDSPKRKDTSPEPPALKLQNLLRLFFILFALLISSRLLFLFAFPAEIDLAAYQLSYSIFFIGWLVLHTILVAVYLFTLVTIGFFFRLKSSVRHDYLKRVLKRILVLFYLDLVFLFLLYFFFHDHFTYPDMPKAGILPERHFGTNQFVFLAYIISIILFIFFYFKFKQRRSAFYLKFYGISFIFTLLLSIYLSANWISSYYGITVPDTDSIGIFSFREGFFGWFWILYAMLTLLSHLLIYEIRKLKDGFISIQFYMNMLTHGLRFNFICTAGIIIITVLPMVMRYFYT